MFLYQQLYNHSGLNVYCQFKQYNKDILDFFYNRDHRHIVVIGLEEKLESVTRKFKVEKNDKDLKIDHYFDPVNLNSYLDLLRNIFTQNDKPTALLVHDISKVQQTINLLNNLKLSVPEDVSIITIEHKYQDAEQCFPSVTSVYVPAYQMGIESANVLFEYLQGTQEFSKEIVVDSNIIERNSVKNPLKMSDF